MLLPMPLCLNLAVATGWISCLWDVSHLNVMVMSVQACKGRSIYAKLCEEQQLQLLGTKRLTVADEIRMHSETVCNCDHELCAKLCELCAKTVCCAETVQGCVPVDTSQQQQQKKAVCLLKL